MHYVRGYYEWIDPPEDDREEEDEEEEEYEPDPSDLAREAREMKMMAKVNGWDIERI